MQRKPVYFVCDWSTDKPEAFMTINKHCAEKVGEIVWRGEPVNVQLIYTDSFITLKEQFDRKLTVKFAIYKSNLQKQIRMQDVNALETWRKMWIMNKFESLRRLIVITIEDVQLYQETAVVSWLMAATSKGFKPGTIHKVWLENYVIALVNADKKVAYRDQDEPVLMDLIQDQTKHSTILAAILFRTAYGGLAGDVKLIKNAVSALTPGRRRTEEIPCLSFPDKLPECKFEILSSAVDFHVYPEISQLINEKYPIYKVSEIKDAIWNYSSKINTRCTQTSENDGDIWIKIKNYFYRCGNNFLRQKID